MLEFLCVDLHNQCDNVINQCYFIFCIVVYNGAEYILLLDFLWTHPNSLDWPIESSGPNNEWYISAKTLFLASSWLKRACTLKSTWTESWGGNGRAHWTRIFIPSLDWASSWTPMENEMVFHGINQCEHLIYCHLMHALMSTCDPMSFKFSSIGIRALYGWHLSCISGLFWVSRFLVLKPFFWRFFFFVWCWFLVFKPNWCWRLVENIVWSKTHHFYDFLEFIWWDFEN